MSIEAMRQAREVIQDYVDEYGPYDKDSGAQYVLNQLDQAIAEAEKQEPVAWACRVIGGKKWLSIHASKGASDKWLEYRIKEQARNEQYEQVELFDIANTNSTEEIAVWLETECEEQFLADRVRSLFLHPQPAHPKREWVGLTDEEIMDMYNEPRSDAEMIAFGREVEAKLKEKNT